MTRVPFAHLAAILAAAPGATSTDLNLYFGWAPPRQITSTSMEPVSVMSLYWV
jgi:hypothetical protein